MAEVWVNDAKTTLQAAIGPSDTELVLTDPSKFPATGNFRLRVDTGQNVEYMLGTARSGSTVTVTRGIEGSTAIAHAINVACVHTLTAGSLETLAAGGSVDATAVTYEPGTPGNWSPAPTEVAAALDQLAARSVSPLTANLNANDFDIYNVAVLTADGEFNNGNSGAAATINWNSGNDQTITLTANCTFTFTAPTLGGAGKFLFRITQDGTGNRLATWPASVKWVNQTPPTLTGAANATDIVSFYWNRTNYWGTYSPNFG